MKSLEEAAAFQKQLREVGSYQTDPNHPVSALGRSDLWYYIRMINFLWEGSRYVVAEEYTPARQSAHSFTFLGIVEDCGGKIDISGFTNATDLGRPCVFIGNHMSLIEGFLTPLLLLTFGGLAAVAKESLMNIPLLGAVTKAVKPILVKRVNPREDLKAVMEQGKALLAEGRSIVIFPQATRSHHFDRNAFNSLGVKLAKKASAPVIPFALKTDFQGNGRIIKDIGPVDRSKKIHFRLGPPLTVEGSGKATNEKVMDFIESSLKEWSQ